STILTISTAELKDESWNVKSSGLKGPLKDLAAVAAFAISASPLGQMAMAAGMDTEMEVGKTSESRVESTTHATSTITAGETLAIKTDGDFRLEGSEANAKNASIETRSTTITAVENTTTTTESESTHTVGATQAALKKDEVTVAGATETKHSETTTTTDTELVKAGLNVSENLAMNSVENIDVLASDVNVGGNAKVKAKTITVAGLAETTTTEHKEKTETITTSVGVKNAYVDTAYALQAVVDAGAAVDAAKSALDQAKRDVKNGTLQANAVDDYKANLAAATTQLGQATLSAAASAATAAGTTGTGGFYASGSAEKTIVEKTSTDTEERYIGSNFNVGGDASFDATDSIDIIGSGMDIGGGLALNAKDVTIKAGTEETTSTSSETTRTAGMTASYGSGGSEAFSGGVNASGSNTDADSYSKTHINSSINAGSLTSTSDNLTLSGANVEVAGGIDIDTGNLVIESLQDESTSSSKTEGYSASANIGGDKSISPGNFGANENSSNADSKWVNNQTTLIGGTSGSGDVNISADKTTLKGAVVASATRNEDGSLTDNGTLNLATDELIIEDLNDKDHSESKGFDVSTSVGYNSDNPDTKSTDEGYLTGSTTIGLTSDGHKTEQTTLATLGGGNITKKDGSAHEEGLVESANSDLNNSQEITKDMKTGGLNATVTVDHRLLSENGLNDIAEDIEDGYEHGEDIARAVDTIIETDELGILNVGEGIHNNTMSTQLKNDLIRNPENAHILAGLQSGSGEEYDAATKALGKLAQEKFGLEASEINLYDGDETTSGTLANNALGDVAGGVVIDENNSEYGKIFIDAGDGATKTDMANTLGHEVLETQSLQGKDGGVFGANSEQTQEAMGNAFGVQFADRINQAAGGNLDSTGGAAFSSDLKNSNSVASGTQSANNVGNATVDHRQLYVAEAKAIIDAAPAYAKDRNISEAEAKKELTQQALLQVDKEWSEQKHIEENPEARAVLAGLSATKPPAKDGYVEGGEVGLFIATPDDFENPYTNANQARMIEAGMAGEEGFLSTNATANGEMPVGLTPGEVVTGTITGALGSLQDAGEALINDFPSAMQSAASAIGESVSGCIDQGIGCVASDPREGYSGDRAFVDLLQGDKESAIANNATAMAGEVLPAATVVNQAGRVVGEVAETIKESLDNKLTSSDTNSSGLGQGDVDGEMIGLNQPPTIDDISSIPKGERPEPSTYLSTPDEAEHVELFDNGASRFMTSDNLDKYGPGQRDGTSFAMPFNEADELEAGFTTPQDMEDKLGLPGGMLSEQELVRVDFPEPKENNVRVPSGNEAGANDQWMPGGKLPEGTHEAVLDVTPNTEFTVRPVKTTTKPEGNFSNINDPENTFRGPNSPEVLRADVDHGQQTGSRVTDPNRVVSPAAESTAEAGSKGANLNTRKEFHDQRVVDAQQEIKTHGANTTKEATVVTSNGETARLDIAIAGGQNQSIPVPKGFIAEDRHGVPLPVQEIKLDNQGLAIAEVKTGKAKLERQQPECLAACEAGTATVRGEKIKRLDLEVGDKAPESVVILRDPRDPIKDK
ncbi:MAG: hemagglutinin repeat-containing protein, partial [Oleispira sp.]